MEAVKESSDTSFVNSKLGSITEKHGGSNRASTLLWVLSSIGLEHMPDTHEVTGSSPVAPTTLGCTQTILIRWITCSGVENVGSNPTCPTMVL